MSGGLTYNQYIDQIRLLSGTSPTDPWFARSIAGMIDYAEKRLYRDLNLLSTVQSTTVTFTTGNRAINLPSDPYFVTVQQVNVITPAGSSPSAGTRTPLLPVSRVWLNYSWPSNTGAGVPQKFAMEDQDTIIVGPWPDAAYTVEIVGTIRPAAISPTNATTQLSLHFPDLFIAASMIFITGYQQNFGAQSDNPQSAQSWETQYTALLGPAVQEEMRKKANAA